MVSTSTDLAKKGAIGFGVMLLMVYVLNIFAPELAVSIGPIIFIIIAAIGLFIVLRILKKGQTLDIGTVAVFILVGGILVWVLNKFPSIAPGFSIVVRQSLSIVGMG